MAIQISVVVPVFNAAHSLPRCLDALAQQDFQQKHFEVIVVDNNSTDASVAVAERYSDVKRLHEPKQGSYAARNTGIAAARGEVIAFLDPDCIPEPGWLSSMARALDVTECDIVLGRRTCANPSRGLRTLSDYDTALAEFVLSGENPDLYFGYCNNMAVRRPLLAALGNFREVVRGADTVLIQEAIKARGCDAVGFAPDAAVVHLELNRIRDFFGKRMIYGASYERLRALGTARPLRLSERMRVFAKTVEDHNYSALMASELLALLAVGSVFYSVGRLRGRRTRTHSGPIDSSASSA